MGFATRGLGSRQTMSGEDSTLKHRRPHPAPHSANHAALHPDVAFSPTLDDRSMDNSQTLGVTCLTGTCTAFMLGCGKPCGSGTRCFSCSERELHSRAAVEAPRPPSGAPDRRPTTRRK